MEIDPGRLRQLGDPDSCEGRALLGVLLTAYVEDTRMGLAGLREATRTRDAAALRKLAHKLKGSSGMIGANHLAQLFARVEAGSAQDPAELDALVASAALALQTLVVELGAWMGEHRA